MITFSSTVENESTEKTGTGQGYIGGKRQGEEGFVSRRLDPELTP